MRLLQSSSTPRSPLAWEWLSLTPRRHTALMPSQSEWTVRTDGICGSQAKSATQYTLKGLRPHVHLITQHCMNKCAKESTQLSWKLDLFIRQQFRKEVLFFVFSLYGPPPSFLPPLFLVKHPGESLKKQIFNSSPWCKIRKLAVLLLFFLFFFFFQLIIVLIHSFREYF